MRRPIVDELEGMGVHVGRTLWQLDNALDDIADGTPSTPRSYADAIGELFGD